MYIGGLHTKAFSAIQPLNDVEIKYSECIKLGE